MAFTEEDNILIKVRPWLWKVYGAYYRDVFLPSSTCLAATCTSHSTKTVPLRTEHVRPLFYCPGRHPTSYHRSCGHPTVRTLIQLTIKSGVYWRSVFIVPAYIDHLRARL